jgi:hypothetical protein
MPAFMPGYAMLRPAWCPSRWSRRSSREHVIAVVIVVVIVIATFTFLWN